MYDIKYRKSQQNTNADFLSRLPCSEKVESVENEFVVRWTKEVTKMNETQLKSAGDSRESKESYMH